MRRTPITARDEKTQDVGAVSNQGFDLGFRYAVTAAMGWTGPQALASRAAAGRFQTRTLVLGFPYAVTGAMDWTGRRRSLRERRPEDFKPGL